MFDEAERIGLEGIVGKRAASPYVSKRSTDWLKVNAAKPTTSSSSATCRRSRAATGSARCSSRSTATAS